MYTEIYRVYHKYLKKIKFLTEWNNLVFILIKTLFIECDTTVNLQSLNKYIILSLILL